MYKLLNKLFGLEYVVVRYAGGYHIRRVRKYAGHNFVKFIGDLEKLSERDHYFIVGGPSNQPSDGKVQP